MRALTEDRRATVSWLHRRAGLGLSPGAATELASSDDPVADLTGRHPDGSDVPGGPQPVDPWEGADIPTGGEGRREVISTWLRHLLTSDTPWIERRTSFLSGWLVSSATEVPPPTMVEQVRLFRSEGGGSYPDLLRAVTIDPAMLVYLDGVTSRRGAPNENYGRELLELFALGTGTPGHPAPYDESDVAAAAAALTGWTIDRSTLTGRFVPARHDDTTHRFLGADGVHDVDTVIDAIVAHPEHDRFVADRIAREFVGAVPGDDGNSAVADDVIDELVDAYRSHDRRIDPTVATALRIALDGRSAPIVIAPIPWLVGVARTLEVRTSLRDESVRRSIAGMGQIPLAPPSVAGWPGGERWLTTGGLVARANAAAALAHQVADDHPVAVAVDDGDLDAVATWLGLLEPFSTATADAIRGASGRTARLTLSLISPEYLLT